MEVKQQKFAHTSSYTREQFLEGDPLCLGSHRKWGKYGQAGIDMSDLIPHMHAHANDIAVIRALESLKRRCPVEIYTDSQYVKQGIERWIHTWKANGWKTSARKAVKNADLWQALDHAAAQHDIVWHWVKGHADTPGNHRADELANLGVDALR